MSKSKKVKRTIGDQNMFKLTPKSACALLKAIIETEADVLYMAKDTTCPDTYMITAIEISQHKVEKFESIANVILENMGEIKGC
jgi:hypothetical protein